MTTAADLAPGVLLQRMYSRTRRCLDGSPRERSMRTQELVDGTLNDVDRLVRGGRPEDLYLLLSEMRVDQVHPEALDVITALVEGMSLPSIKGFKDRVDGRIARVDEVLKPIVLRRGHGGQDYDGRAIGGEVISQDVRKDARAIYRERAKAFGDVLRKNGNLDRFYKTAAMKRHART